MPWTYTIANVIVPKQTSTRNRDTASGASFAARSHRAHGHAPHLSISDDSHHVTETIGFLYGDDDERDPKRASNAASIARSSIYSDHSEGDSRSPQRTSFPRRPVQEATSPLNRSFEHVNGQQIPHPSRSLSFERSNGHSSPPMTNSQNASPAETAQAHFPLTDIDYESSPAAVAQELNNLQALRRMSMHEGAAGDPDLPTLNPATIPNAPSPTTSDDDSSRLFWVPARLHPELAPGEFKSFLETKTEQIRRRSGDLSSLGSSPMSSRAAFLSSNSSGLSRKKSMLSREVNNSNGYKDGADILERKRSESHKHQPSDPNLAELETLVANNLQLQRPQSPADDDVDFILPSVPSSSLKRSTKTRYQRGGGGIKGRRDATQRSLRRVQTEGTEIVNGRTTPASDVPDLPSNFLNSDAGNSLADTLSFAQKPTGAQNFARPAANRSPSPPQENDKVAATPTFDTILGANNNDRFSAQSAPEGRGPRKHIIHSERNSIPQIVETPPADPQHKAAEPPPQNAQQSFPSRTSSRESSIRSVGPSRPAMPRQHSSAQVTTTKTNRAEVPPLTNPKQSLEQPSPLPGNDTNTSNLSFIPTLTVDKQSQEQQQKKKSGWKWLLGQDDEKDKGKGRTGKTAQSHDNTRLDVLQTSIDGNSKRRETIELSRDDVRLEEERKKMSERKPSSTEKKEGGFISSLFGGKKSKAEKESKKSPRLSPEPPYRELKADIDYSWTRFSILEERAIYRMAHIKLANPRRALYSQVLLSNFMYSYLAKVQQMHPQMNLPTSAKQQKKQKEQPPQQQSDEFSTYQRYQQVSNVRHTVLNMH